MADLLAASTARPFSVLPVTTRRAPEMRKRKRGGQFAGGQGSNLGDGEDPGVDADVVDGAVEVVAVTGVGVAAHHQLGRVGVGHRGRW